MTDEHWYARKLSEEIEARLERKGYASNVVDDVIDERRKQKSMTLLKQAYGNLTHNDKMVRWVCEWLWETPHSNARYLLVETQGCNPTTFRCGTPVGDALIQYETGTYRLVTYCAQ